MDNFFLVQLFDWNWRSNGRWLERANALLNRAGSSWTLCRLRTPHSHTTSAEQRLSLWHLASQPFAYGVPGDAVELGCFGGKTAVIFARVLAQFAPKRALHLYDHFQVQFHLDGVDIQERLRDNFRQAACPLPHIHAGDFFETLPAALPASIAFAHFDCGYDDDLTKQHGTMHHLLTHVYPRMPRGAIGVVMDYYDAAVCRGPNVNPGIGPAVDEFFADKPENVVSLWGGEYTHAYFRKVCSSTA